jgi:hypothetical protein
LVIRSGAIQTATGDISIKMGGNISLQNGLDFASSNSSLGAIRTTGYPTIITYDGKNYQTYKDGGDIVLKVGGSVEGGLASQAWDFSNGIRMPRYWTASFKDTDATEGLATLGGGNLSISAGGSFFSQAGTFGEGDLEILSGGNILGRFLVKRGSGNLIALGRGGSAEQPLVFELFDARITTGSIGDINFGAAVNPTIARDQFRGVYWDLSYSFNSEIKLVSKIGDVRLFGDSQYYDLLPSESMLERIMPPTLEISAGRDILISNTIALAPAPFGNLILSAGRDIDGQYKVETAGEGFYLERGLISMSDSDPARVYGLMRNPSMEIFFEKTEHSETPVHKGDFNPISIKAGRDIKNLQFYLPKRAEISAGRDIIDIYYSGQNIHLGEETRISASHDIFFSTRPGINSDTGIEHGGPGVLSVIAGNMIDLGTTKGISTLGNTINRGLGSEGSDVFISSGYIPETFKKHDIIVQFFKDLMTGGLTFSELLNSGNKPGAKSEIDRLREQTIEPLLGKAASGTGVIDMTTSQISTFSGRDDIYILSGGHIDVGRSTFVKEEQRQSTGIFTASGGSIGIYAEGDINVNESRVMTFRGGDISIWSNLGNINAGRGSKTAINLDPPKVEKEYIPGTDPPQYKYFLVFRPPAVGSGIRAVTYDPDGIEGPLQEPPPGDIFAFAPQGVIDAGEAGIAGGNVTLGATAVLNAQNISFAFGSVGVPDAGGVSTGIGALAGAGSVSETAKIAQESSSLKSAEERMAKFTEELNKNLVPKIIMVEVLGFEEEKVN